MSTKWYSVHRSPSPRFWFILSLPSLSSFCDFSRMSVSVAILASASSSFSSRSVKVTSLLADLSVSREPPSTSATHHTGPRASRRRRLVLVLLKCVKNVSMEPKTLRWVVTQKARFEWKRSMSRDSVGSRRK